MPSAGFELAVNLVQTYTSDRMAIRSGAPIGE